MTEDITVMAQERVATAARLNALLGREATVPVGARELAWPDSVLPRVDSLVSVALARRPKLRAARERAAAATFAYRQARRELFPDFTLGLAYGQRPQFANMASAIVGT